MENLNVKSTLPALSFDYEGLKAWAKGITEQYEGVVVREEDIIGIKSEMAGLNKIKKQLNDARIATVKQVSAPIREFEEQIKEVVGIITDTRTMLDEQVKAHEERQREERRHQVIFMIDAAKDEHGADFPIEINPSWLNKSAKPKTIRAEIDQIILAHLKAEREARELEQARKDRAVAIEQTCATLAKQHGITLPPSQFLRLHDMEIPLGEANKQIEAAYQTRAAAIQAQKLEEQKDAPTLQPVEPVRHTAPRASKAEPRQNNTGPFEETHTVTLELTYTDSQADAVETILRQLQGASTNLFITDRVKAA
jgi:hypothetical protein